MQNTALHHVPMGTVFQLHGAHHFSHSVHAFLDREIPDRWIGRGGGPIPWPLFLQIFLLCFFFPP